MRQCECFKEDPWPPLEFPTVRDGRRRFYHYRTIAWKLGIEPGKRVKLPGCVCKRIEELYGESKVGFRSSRVR